MTPITTATNSESARQFSSYVLSKLSKGYTYRDIEAELVANGWQLPDAREAIKAVRVPVLDGFLWSYTGRLLCAGWIMAATTLIACIGLFVMLFLGSLLVPGLLFFFAALFILIPTVCLPLIPAYVFTLLWLQKGRVRRPVVLTILSTFLSLICLWLSARVLEAYIPIVTTIIVGGIIVPPLIVLLLGHLLHTKPTVTVASN